jgi:hypothetical protein
MLRVLTAKSAYKSAPVAPGVPHPFHGLVPFFSGLALEQPPTRTIRPFPGSAPLGQTPRGTAQRGELLCVESAELPQSELEEEAERRFLTRDPSVLHELAELALDAHRQRVRRCGGRRAPSDEASNGVGARGSALLPLILVESSQLLLGKPDTEEVREAVGSSRSHLCNTI